MKKTIYTALLSLVGLNLNAQFVATVEIKEPIEGICNDKEVYALFPMLDGQVEAVCPLTDDEIVKRLNAEVQFLKDNPKFKGEGMVSVMINCKGEVVQCKIDNETSSSELDEQIVAVFKTINEGWKAGKLNKKSVDSMLLYSFTVKKGVISFD